MVLPDLMDSEDNLNEYIKVKNIEGKLPIKKNCKPEDSEEDKSECNHKNHSPIENDIESEKSELENLNDVTASKQQESLVDNNSKCDRKTPEIDKEAENKKKGILKYKRTYSNKHVDFNMDLEFVPFDESKDYTIDIQIVEQMPKKIVSYAALFAQQKKEEEEKLMKEAKEKEKQNRKQIKKRKYHEWKKIQKQGEKIGIEHESSHFTGNDGVENQLSTEDEMDDISELSYHSDTDKEENSDISLSVEHNSKTYVDNSDFANLSEEPGIECKTPTEDLNRPLNDRGKDHSDTAVSSKSESGVSEVGSSFTNQAEEPARESKSVAHDLNKSMNDVEKNHLDIAVSAESEDVTCEGGNSTNEAEAPVSESKPVTHDLNKPMKNVIGKDHSDVGCTKSEGATSENDSSFTNQSGLELESKTISGDLILNPLKNTETETEMKQFFHNESLGSKCKNSRVDKSHEKFIIFENNAANLQIFCVPAKKKRSSSLSDLDEFKKSHRFAVKRLPREIELIISRQLEERYYK